MCWLKHSRKLSPNDEALGNTYPCCIAYILTIYCDGKETATYDSGDMHKITFEQNSGIHDLKGDDSDSGMLTRDGATGIRLSGFIAGTQVGVYTTGGLCVRHFSIPDDNSDISIDLEGLNPGIYIVTAGNSSFKISLYQ